ncbi:MAG: hypothetical protein IJ666_05310 [Ruminococcus sp.]|nr:hypothetical protein [Ruminococcus sp.]
MIRKYLVLSVAVLTAVLSFGCRSVDTANYDENLAGEIIVQETTENTIPEIAETTKMIEKTEITEATSQKYPPFLNSPDDILLADIDGYGENYIFFYNEEEFRAVYSEDNWKVINSCKITDERDIEIICQALKDVHPIHSADMSDYRDAHDMAYEWVQHNLGYYLLPDESPFKENARDVDLNPADQGKSLYDMFLDRQEQIGGMN